MYKVKLTPQSVVITDHDGNLYAVSDFGGDYIIEDARFNNSIGYHKSSWHQGSSHIDADIFTNEYFERSKKLIEQRLENDRLEVTEGRS